MSNEHSGANGAPTHPDVRCEDPSFAAGGVLLVVIILVVGAIVANVLLYALFYRLKDDRDARVKHPFVAPAVQAQRPQFLPRDLHKERDVPVLQIEEVRDLNAQRQRDTQRLSSYGWVDRKRGIVHLPIETALEQVRRDPQAAAARGLKSRALPEGKP